MPSHGAGPTSIDGATRALSSRIDQLASTASLRRRPCARQTPRRFGIAVNWGDGYAPIVTFKVHPTSSNPPTTRPQRQVVKR